MTTIALKTSLVGLWEAQHKGQRLVPLLPEEWGDMEDCPGCDRPFGELDCGSGSEQEVCDGTCLEGTGWDVFVIEAAIA